MKLLPRIRLTRRAVKDIARCMRFVELQPWGQPEDRERDIYRAFEKIRETPEFPRVEVRRHGTHVELRRRSIAQFIVVYAYFQPSTPFPRGLVSIRALRHRRERDVFLGVREPAHPVYFAQPTAVSSRCGTQ